MVKLFSTDNQYLIFLKKLLILFLTVFILDFSIGRLLEYLYFRQESGFQYRTTQAMEHTTAGILIFGSSRASHHYHPEIFEKRMQLSYYNAGRDGSYIFYDYAVLQAVLKRYTPQIVILDFISDEFRLMPESYDRISVLLPYYKKHPEIRNVIALKSPFEKIKLLSSIYPYNSSLFAILAGNLEFNKERSNDFKGYVPLSRVLTGAIRIDTLPVIYEMDSLKIKAYESFIRACIDSRITLYIVCSPYFAKSKYVDCSIEQGQIIADNYNVPFFDFTRDSLVIDNCSLFADYSHLNNDGAKEFSEMIIERIVRNNSEFRPQVLKLNGQ